MYRLRKIPFTLKKKTLFLQGCMCFNEASSCPMKSQPLLTEIESGWYEWWRENNFFKKATSDEKFVMLLPPPNITGKLHMGHALTCAIQDALIRWNQMNGKHAVWIPGCDHAGIATQIMVEKYIWSKYGFTRHDLGREKFIEEVMKWKREKSEIIFQQMEKMGLAFDWDRLFFTLDPKIAKGVFEVFARLFETGLLYRGNRIVNWCSALQSAISDFEVDKLDVDGPTEIKVIGHDRPITFGYLYELKYRLIDTDQTVTVCTTRPETMLGDTALVVHPDDPRYLHLRGKRVFHPLRRDTIPILEDSSVSQKLGTGVVKVTPGHSFQDYEIASRCNLPSIEILDDKGWILPIGGIESQPRFDAREEVLNKLASLGLLGEKKPHSLQLPICMRSGDVIEPRLKIQWFLSSKEMTDKARSLVREGSLRFHPPYYSTVWENFLAEGRDWCVSRQLWWGHRIPIYWGSVLESSIYGSEVEIESKNSVFLSAMNKEEAMRKAAEKLGVKMEALKVMKQDDDVLDTWFSSAILPFVVLGWPEKNDDFDTLYPLSLMETGHDILFFWVARMVMLSVTLTNKLPFKDVLLHGILIDTDGKKMSKSKGNALDPIHIIEGKSNGDFSSSNSSPNDAFGADALRFSLCLLDVKRQRMAIDIRNIRQEHFFRNKIWQTFRFLINHHETIPESIDVLKPFYENRVVNVMDKWILSQLAQAVMQMHEGFESFNVHVGAASLKNFWLSSLCDVYLEMCKPRLWNYEASPDSALRSLQVLWNCCYISLLLLSPFMPFLSENLYKHLPSFENKNRSIMECSAPCKNEWLQYKDETLDECMEQILNAASSFRKLRKTYNITSKRQHGIGTMIISSDLTRQTALEITSELKRLCFLSELKITSPFIELEKEDKIGTVTYSESSCITIQLNLKNLIDPVAEIDQLTKRLTKLQKEEIRLQKRISHCESHNTEPRPNDINKVVQLSDKIKEVDDLISNIKKIFSL